VSDYFKANSDYWEKGYSAPMVDHHMFRFYGRILKPQFNLPHNNTSLLDFGCGQGAAVNYFSSLKFNAYGSDISHTDINAAKIRYPHIKDYFSVCEADPKNVVRYGGLEKYDVVTGFQAFYYFNKSDFNVLMQKIYNQMNTGGIFFATMMGTKSTEYFENSNPTEDEWLRKVDFSNGRIKCSDYYIFFVEDEDDLCKKFEMFKPLHLGYYCAKLNSNEGDGFHYTFCGIKE